MLFHLQKNLNINAICVFKCINCFYVPIFEVIDINEGVLFSNSITFKIFLAFFGITIKNIIQLVLHFWHEEMDVNFIGSSTCAARLHYVPRYLQAQMYAAIFQRRAFSDSMAYVGIFLNA